MRVKYQAFDGFKDREMASASADSKSKARLERVDSEILDELNRFSDVIARKLKQRRLEEEPGELLCPTAWRDHILRVLWSEEEIQLKVKELAASISRDYRGKEVICVGMLTGAVCFMVDLLKYLDVPYTMDFMAVSSYGDRTSSKGSVNLKKDMSTDPKGKHILVVEDIIDTGGTLKWLKSYLEGKDCASVRIACLLDKPARRKAECAAVSVDYMGFKCPNEFVIGYGMDFANQYRCLPFIGVLKPEIYEAE